MKPESAAEYVPIATLVPWPGNPRANAKAVDKVAESIRRFGFAAPIVARLANRQVIAGHTRLLAARKLGLEQVPVRFLDLDEQQAHALSLADNRTGEIAEWNDEALAEVLRDLQAQEVDIAGLGWNEKELASLLGESPGANPLPAPGDAEQDFLLVRFSILVECDNDADQRRLIARFMEEGLKCRAVM